MFRCVEKEGKRQRKSGGGRVSVIDPYTHTRSGGGRVSVIDPYTHATLDHGFHRMNHRCIRRNEGGKKSR